MLNWARRRILTILRVPPEPHAPEGTPGSVMVFRAGRNFYRWQVLGWFYSHFAVATGLVAGYLTAGYWLHTLPRWAQFMHYASEVAALLAVTVGLPFTFLALRWSYELRWYIVTDRSLRIRRGVWNVEELTMTFANIQEIRVTSGPIQNWLGLADVEVHSAGGGAAGPHGETKEHLAVFEGVENANEIRDLIIERLRQYRDLGLGGGASQIEPMSGKIDAAALTAAYAALVEARALRASLTHS